jgi:hypothetical protein
MERAMPSRSRRSDTELLDVVGVPDVALQPLGTVLRPERGEHDGGEGEDGGDQHAL